MHAAVLAAADEFDSAYERSRMTELHQAILNAARVQPPARGQESAARAGSLVLAAAEPILMATAAAQQAAVMAQIKTLTEQLEAANESFEAADRQHWTVQAALKTLQVQYNSMAEVCC